MERSYSIKNYRISEFIELFSPISMPAEIYEKITADATMEGREHLIKKQYCDPSYQRNYGSWGNYEKNKYIESIFEETAYNPIVLGRLDEREATKKHDEPESVIYSCIDGQHRSQTLADFLTDKYHFSGNINANGFSRTVVNVTFSQLEPREQETFLRRKNVWVGIEDLREEFKRDGADIFLKVNSGEPLNPQEKRNALRTNIAEWSRIQATEYSDLFKKVNQIKIERMADREFISKILMFLENYHKENLIKLENTEHQIQHIDMRHPQLDDFYRKGVKNNNAYNKNLMKYISDVLLSDFHSIKNSLTGNRKMKREDMWTYIILHYNCLYYEDEMQRIKPEYSPIQLWEYSEHINKDLSEKQKIAEGEYIKQFNDGLIDEERGNSSWFHNVIGKMHVGGSAKVHTETVMSLFESPSEILLKVKEYADEKFLEILKSMDIRKKEAAS